MAGANRGLIVGLAVAAGMGLLLMAWTMTGYGSMDGYDGYGWGMHGNWWPWMGLGMALFWIPIIILAIVLISRSSGGSRTALEQLDARYARGDIGREEYQRIRGDLDKPR